MKSVISKLVHHAHYGSIPRLMSTSLSNNQAYPQVCLDAVMDYRLFNEFRRNKVYNEILEHVTEEQGYDYCDLIKRDAELWASIDAFKPNDDLGNPRVYDYPEIGTISPTTLRYVKVLADLKRIFGSLDGMRICEIGVGYGGQCRVINEFFKPSEYCLVDIKPALGLAERFLDHFVMPASLTFSTMNCLHPRDYDLVISNYAFTELPRTVQQVYMDRAILRSARGYITYNQITPPEFKSLKRDELLATIDGSQSIDEEPLTHPDNCIIVWGE